MKTRAYIGGTFDLLHAGHINLFRRAKAIADEVVVVLNTDDFAERYKRRPVMDLGSRMEMVRAIKYVDDVDVNVGGEDSKISILKWRPNYIIHGDDWTGDSYLKQLGIDQSFLDLYGIQIIYFPYTKKISTTDLIGRLHGI